MTPALDGPARLAGAALLRLQRDDRLVELVSHGHARAFEVLVDRYRRELLRHAARVAGEGRAEDVLQTALASAHRALRDTAPDDLRAWLHRIVHNAAINALREPSWEAMDAELKATGADVESIVEGRQQVRAVLGAMQGLPERQRDALVMREIQGYGHDEIAATLGVGGGAARQLIHRARNTVRAAATALTPTGLLLRLPFEHAAEVGAAGAGAGLMAKVAVGTAFGGAALAGGTAGVVILTKADPAGTESARAARVAPARPTLAATSPVMKPIADGTGAASAPSSAGERRGDRLSARRTRRHGATGDDSDDGTHGQRSEDRESDGESHDDDSSGHGRRPAGSGHDSDEPDEPDGGRHGGSGSSDSGESGSGSESSGSGSGSSGSGPGPSPTPEPDEPEDARPDDSSGHGSGKPEDPVETPEGAEPAETDSSGHGSPGD